MKLATCIVFFFTLAFCPNAARAEGLSGSMELNYSTGNSVSDTPQGATAKFSSKSFQQRYRLSYDRSFYPNLHWNAGATVEKEDASSSGGELEARSTNTRVAPATDLTLSARYINAGIGFRRNEERQSSGDVSATNVRDSYFANLGLRPDDLPNLDVSFQRNNSYDKDRISENRLNDAITLSSRYSPIKGLDLGYQGSFTSASDLLTDFRVDTETHSGRATYAGKALKNRITFGSSYSITQNKTAVASAGKGEVVTQEFAATGLAGIDEPPAMAADDALAAAPDLINNITATGAASLNLNIGFQNGLDLRTRNFGLDFGIGSNKEINTLFVYVSDAVDIAAVANFFTWEVYTSADAADPFALRHWTQQSVTAVSFNPFDRRFEIKLPRVTARFFKAVTRPLPATAPQAGNIALANIFVTELQALISKPVSEVPKKSSQTSQTYDLSVRTRLLNYPLLAHDFYYWTTETNQGGAARHLLANGISATHTFNRIFSGSARIAREDSTEPTGDRVAYAYSASVRAAPLPTLSHNLSVSRREEDAAGQKSDSASLFLNNMLELYRGVNLTLSEGVSNSTSATGQKSNSLILNYGANIIPHPTLTATLYYSDTKTKQTGGDQGDSESATKRMDLSLAYRPFPLLYFSYSYSVAQASGKEKSTLQSYGTTWSPFPSGAVQFNISYAESLQSDNVSKNSSLTPSLRWNINARTYLTLSYLATKSDSQSQTSKTESFNANFTMFFF